MIGFAVGAWVEPKFVAAQVARVASLPTSTIPKNSPPPAGFFGPKPGAAPRIDRLAPDFAPWWQDEVLRQLRDSAGPLQMPLDQVVLGALTHSPQVRIFTDNVQIQRTAIVQASAAFDPRSYMQTNFINTSDPVGSLLTTGGASRFLDQNWNYTSGVKQRTTTGAQLDLSQRMGYQDNNSIYFVPAPQGTVKTALSLTQPLLQGAGKEYNSSLIVLAELSTNVAHDQMSKDLQDVLLKVHQAYWEVYLLRSALLQKRKLHWQAAQILEELSSRQDVDVLGNQLVRARAAVATREAAMIRYLTEVQNAEARLRTLINDPALMSNAGLELIPVQRPNLGYLDINLGESLVSAFANRPEINQANREMRAAAVRAEVSKNEVLPVLNMILGTYVYGLHGGGDVVAAYGNQFTLGRPTYSAGVNFEMPFGNRAANARLRQRRLEYRQAVNQMQITTSNVRTEVEIAVREVTTTYQEMLSKSYAMTANQGEVQFLRDRWRLLPGDQQVAGVVLHDLLNAQERLADSEYGFARSLVDYNVALINYKRCSGTLLQYEQITEAEVDDQGLPRLELRRPVAPGIPQQQASGTAPPLSGSAPAPFSPPQTPPPAADQPQQTGPALSPPALASPSASVTPVAQPSLAAPQPVSSPAPQESAPAPTSALRFGDGPAPLPPYYPAR